MATVNLAADSSTLTLNGTVIDDFVDGDTLTMTPVNPVTGRMRSLRGINIQERSDKDVYDLVFRVPKYSDSDIFLNTEVNQSPPTVFDGTLKEVYDRDGVEITNTYTLEAGSFTTQPTDTRNNQDGNNMMEYTIQFDRAVRV